MTQNVGQFLTKRAYRDPSQEAIYEAASDRRLTYAQLNDRSNQVANALTGLGVGHGDRVGLLLMNGTEFVEAFFGVGKIGAVNVPLNWRLVADELEFILSDAGCTVLLLSGEFAEVDADALTFRELHLSQQTGAGAEVLIRVFGVETYLNGVARRCEVGTQLIQIRQCPTGQTDHPFHQIDAEHFFGNTVLNL